MWTKSATRARLASSIDALPQGPRSNGILEGQPRGDRNMGNPQPLEVAMDFIKRINSGDVTALCELMTEGHIFQDALGKRSIGRETMRQGWTMYFKMVADYLMHAVAFCQPDDGPALLGPACG